jgi:hypothetical protein
MFSVSSFFSFFFFLLLVLAQPIVLPIGLPPAPVPLGVTDYVVYGVPRAPGWVIKATIAQEGHGSVYIMIGQDYTRGACMTLLPGASCSALALCGTGVTSAPGPDVTLMTAQVTAREVTGATISLAWEQLNVTDLALGGTASATSTGVDMFRVVAPAGMILDVTATTGTFVYSNLGGNAGLECNLNQNADRMACQEPSCIYSPAPCTAPFPRFSDNATWFLTVVSNPNTPFQLWTNLTAVNTVTGRFAVPVNISTPRDTNIPAITAIETEVPAQAVGFVALFTLENLTPNMLPGVFVAATFSSAGSDQCLAGAPLVWEDIANLENRPPIAVPICAPRSGEPLQTLKVYVQEFLGGFPGDSVLSGTWQVGPLFAPDILVPGTAKNVTVTTWRRVFLTVPRTRSGSLVIKATYGANDRYGNDDFFIGINPGKSDPCQQTFAASSVGSFNAGGAQVRLSGLPGSASITISVANPATSIGNPIFLTLLAQES